MRCEALTLAHRNQVKAAEIPAVLYRTGTDGTPCTSTAGTERTSTQCTPCTKCTQCT